MSKLSDEILNRYLDGELSESDRIKVENQIEFSEEDRKNYIALKTVHSGLTKIKSFEVSPDFTSVLLFKIMKKSKAKKEQRVFILSISSVFVIICLIIIGFVLSSILGSYSGQSGNIPVMNNFKYFINDFAGIITEILSGKNMSLVGSILSFGIIISGYFFFENHKRMKEIK